MESLLEKITLYDLLGYMFSGCILNLMILLGLYQQYSSEMEKIYEDYEGGLTFAFFLISYLAGILLSEISEFINTWIKKLLKKVKMSGSIGGMEETGASEEELAAALVSSGIMERPDKIKEKINSQGWQVYMKYMYGLLQSDERYRRIHNYASIVVLCKNVSMALVSGMLFLLLYRSCSFILGTAILLSVVVLIRRGVRFKKKKDTYTIVWFIDKYKVNSD